MARTDRDGAGEGRHGRRHKAAGEPVDNQTVTQRSAWWGDLVFRGDCFSCSSTGSFLLPCQRSSSMTATVIEQLETRRTVQKACLGTCVQSGSTPILKESFYFWLCTVCVWLYFNSILLLSFVCREDDIFPRRKTSFTHTPATGTNLNWF